MMNAKMLLHTADTSGQDTAAAAEPPDLIGNWTGTMYGYEDGPGYTDFSGYDITMSVTEQKDRIVPGETIFTNATGYEVRERKPFRRSDRP